MAVQENKIITLPQEIIYPESDGQPMAENTLQARWIIMLYDNLNSLFIDQDVFIAADLFWYPVEGDPHTKYAPDVMVAFDRPKGDRGSYKQWEEGGIAPQVVVEVIPDSNAILEMLDKFEFYKEYGVAECIFLDPKENSFLAYVAKGDKLTRDNQPDQAWYSPKLGIGFQVIEGVLTALYADGTPMKTFDQIMAEKAAAEEAEKIALKSEQKALEAEKAALAEVERLKAKLRELGENPG